jgi:hypothetical protein
MGGWIQVGQEVSVRNDIVIRPFATCHTVPSQGYLIVSRRKKLKQEYVGASRDVIIGAKKRGIEISDFTEVSCTARMLVQNSCLCSSPQQRHETLAILVCVIFHGQSVLGKEQLGRTVLLNPVYVLARLHLP